MLPPGVDHTDTESVPKPISDAPIPRKGPLPKDFQEALDILFDGDKPKPVVEPKLVPPPIIEQPPVPSHIDTEGPQMILPESIYPYPANFAATFQRYGENNQPLDNLGPLHKPPPQIPPYTKPPPKTLSQPKIIAPIVPILVPPPPAIEEEKSMDTQDEKSSDSNDSGPIIKNPPKKMDNEETRLKRQELEELAMLGIDADDLAAQCF